MKKAKSYPFLFLTGLFGLAILAGIVYAAYQFGQTQIPQPIPAPTPTPQSACVSEKTGATLTLTQAREIAQNSVCVNQGPLKDEAFCNSFTGTWWLDLDIEEPGCTPACVVNLETKKAEINWRCTGVLPPR